MNAGWRVRTAFAAGAKGWATIFFSLVLLQQVGSAVVAYRHHISPRLRLSDLLSMLGIYAVATALVSLFTTTLLLAPYFALRSPESLVTQTWRTYLEPLALILFPVAFMAETMRASVETFRQSFLAFGAPAALISLAGSFFYTRAVHRGVKVATEGAL